MNLLPASALLMTCRHLPGLMSMLAPPGSNRSPLGRSLPLGPIAATGVEPALAAGALRMLAPLGALWMALSWFPRVLFSLLSSAAMQSCAPVPAAGDDVETCSLRWDGSDAVLLWEIV